MPIVAADLKFLSSERMIDALAILTGSVGGGGYAAGPVLQDGVTGNVFPPAGPSDLVGGRRRIRLVYPAVLSNENSRALACGAAVLRRATSSAVDLLAVSAASLPAVRAFAGLSGSEDLRDTYTMARLLDYWGTPLNNGLAGYPAVSFSAPLNTTGGNAVTAGGGSIPVDIVVGDKVAASVGGVVVASWRTVTAIAGGQLTFGGAGLAGVTASTSVTITRYARTPLARISAPAALTAGVAANASTVTVAPAALETRSWPVNATSATPGGITIVTIAVDTTYEGSWAGSRNGVLPAFGVGFPVLIDDLTNGTAPEVRIVQSVNYQTGQITFTTPLSNAYTTGSIVSTLLDCGEWQAQVSLLPFSQQAWTRTWADQPSGPTITPRYTGIIGMNNAGGIDDRWALVFTSATAFNLVSERSGQIASGNTASNFVPLNPLTSQPLMSLPASGWGSGWLPGNVLRFNTRGAHSGVFYVQNISPGATGADEGELIMRCEA